MPHTLIKETFINQDEYIPPKKIKNGEYHAKEKLCSSSDKNQEQITRKAEYERKKKENEQQKILIEAYETSKQALLTESLDISLNKEIERLALDRKDAIPFSQKIAQIQEIIADTFTGTEERRKKLKAWIDALMFTKPGIAAGLLKAILPKQVEIDTRTETRKAPLIINVQNNHFPQNSVEDALNDYSSKPNEVLNISSTPLLDPTENLQ